MLPIHGASLTSAGPAFWWRSLFTVFWLQGAILWFVALPVLVAVRAARPAALSAVDGLGVVLFMIGFSFEVVGRPELIVQAFDMARPAGVVTVVGMPSKDDVIELPALRAVFSGKRLAGSKVGGAQILRDFPRFVRLAESGQLDLGSMVSERISLDQVNDGIDRLHHAEGIRTVIEL